MSSGLRISVVPESLTSEEHITLSNAPDTPATFHATNDDNLWEKLEALYTEHEAKLQAVEKLDFKGQKREKIKQAIESAFETAKVIGDIASIISDINPIFQVVVSAFNSIVKLELSRRDNEKKVIVVELQMQNMMCELFRLRKLQHVHYSDADRQDEKARLERLLKSIASDIIQCGSDLHCYTTQKFISKAWNVMKFENMFKDHIAKFAEHRSQLQLIITAYIAAGIDSIDINIIDLKQDVSNISGQMESITKLFQDLASKEEKKLRAFVDRYGAESVLKNNELLTSLVEMAGDDELVSARDKKNPQAQRERIMRIKKDLQKDLNSDLKDLLILHLDRFKSLLEVQKKNTDAMSNQLEGLGVKMDKLSLQVLEVRGLTAPDVKLEDKEFQKIWEDMKLRQSVKAKTFVLTFRDYYFGINSRVNTPHQRSENPDNLPSPLALSPNPLATSTFPSDSSKSNKDSSWAFKYIDVTRVQPIVEAMDEDGSGFISVKEANIFALSRPKSLSLLSWMAYWAAGWHIDLSYYHDMIYNIMSEMHNTLAYVHPANRAYVEEYLNDDFFIWVEGLLRSLRPAPENSRRDPDLLAVSETIRNLQEEKLLANLTTLSFVAKSVDDISTIVANAGRAETWILPLLYLLLSRHLRIIRLAQNHVLCESELGAHSVSLEHLYSVFTQRMDKLRDIFSQVHHDVGKQFQKHAYGMFYTTFNETTNIEAQNILMDWDGTLINESESTDSDDDEYYVVEKDLSILVEHEEEPFNFDPDIVPAPDLSGPTSPEIPVLGTWIGVCSELVNVGGQITPISRMGGFEVSVHAVSMSPLKISGSGRTFLARLNVDGDVYMHNDGLLEVSFKLFFDGSSDEDVWCKGFYDPASDRIMGNWVGVLPDEDCSDLASFPSNQAEAEPMAYGELSMTRTPTYLHRLRAEIDYRPSQDIRGRARDRWVFAIESVLHRIHPTRHSRFKASQLGERDKWTELYVRGMLNNGSNGYMLNEHYMETVSMPSMIPPENMVVYQQVAIYLSERGIHSRGIYTCDSCDQRIIFTRFICITCIEDDFTNQVDLCSGCIDSDSFSDDRKYMHHHSHSLIRAPFRVHKAEMTNYIESARDLSARIKASLKALEAKKVEKNKDQLFDMKDKMLKGRDTEKFITSQPIFILLKCACCQKDLAQQSLPFWACIECDLDALFCSSCDARNIPYGYHEHDRKHPLLRISSSEEVIISSETQIAKLEKRLDGMEERLTMGIDTRVSSLENEVRAYFGSTPTRSMADNVRNRGTPGGNASDSKFNAQSVGKSLVSLAKSALTSKSSARDATSASGSAMIENPPFEDRLRGLEAKVEDRFMKLEASVNDSFARLFTLVQVAVSGIQSGPQQSISQGQVPAHLPAIPAVSPRQLLSAQPPILSRSPPRQVIENNINEGDDDVDSDAGVENHVFGEERGSQTGDLDKEIDDQMKAFDDDDEKSEGNDQERGFDDDGDNENDPDEEPEETQREKYRDGEDDEPAYDDDEDERNAQHGYSQNPSQYQDTSYDGQYGYQQQSYGGAASADASQGYGYNSSYQQSQEYSQNTYHNNNSMYQQDSFGQVEEANNFNDEEPQEYSGNGGYGGYNSGGYQRGY